MILRPKINGMIFTGVMHVKQSGTPSWLGPYTIGDSQKMVSPAVMSRLATSYLKRVVKACFGCAFHNYISCKLPSNPRCLANVKWIAPIARLLVPILQMQLFVFLAAKSFVASFASQSGFFLYLNLLIEDKLV